MVKNQKTAIRIILSLLLVTSFASTITVKPANATKMALEWGHLCNTDTYDPNEATAEAWVCSNINSYFPAASWARGNNYWTWTTKTIVNSFLQYISTTDDITWATHFWVGDFLHPAPSSPPPPWGHFAFYGDGYGEFILDNSNIYQSTTYYGTRPSKNYFDFIWTCANGGLYWTSLSGSYQNILGITVPDNNYPPWQEPPYIPNNPSTVYGYYDYVYQTSAVGMPYAWTARTDMSKNGYIYPGGSFAYIGFENDSPFMIERPPQGWTSTNLQFKYFVNYFYRYALGVDYGPTHHTIKQSLDYASLMAFGAQYTFGNSYLYHGYWKHHDVGWYYGRARVFGNSNLALPY